MPICFRTSQEAVNQGAISFFTGAGKRLLKQFERTAICRPVGQVRLAETRIRCVDDTVPLSRGAAPFG